jgi:glycosyltransferase involved in cell wall biosynthesis
MGGYKMRVLMLGGSQANPGGVEAFCERSGEALARRGDWEAERIPTETAYLRLSTLRPFLRGLRTLARYRSQRPDCVWLQYVNLPDLAYLLLAKALRMQVMVTPHLGTDWRSQRNPLLRRLSEGALRRADRLALISRTQEQEIALPAGVPRSDIRNFLPESLLEAPMAKAVDSPELHLIHSARLSEGKGTYMVVDVTAQLTQRDVDCRTTITGGADEETFTRLHKLIADRGVRDRVEVRGRVPEPELLDELSRSDVLVHLSRVDSYPLVVLEALAFSVFPLCMELAGARDMVEQYVGHVVPRDDAVEATATFLASADIDDLRRQAREAAVQVRRDYCWDNCASAVEGALGLTVGADRT